MDELGKRKKRRDKSDSSASDSDSSSSSSDEYRKESKLMRLKAYGKLKVPGLPKSPADLRTWKNGLVSQLVACCRSSERELLTWLAKPFEGEEIPPDEFPVLNRVIGSKIFDAAKGTEVQVQGHVLIAKICKKFRLDKEKGMSLSQQHLLALKPQGNEIKDLEIFRDRVEFVLSGLETSDYPAESILRTWIYDCLKSIPRMSLRVDKYREASVGSPQRPEDKGQADPKGKASPKNEVVAGEKGVPCIFYPSGTCRRDPCPYVHDKEAQPKPKPKPKAAAVPIVPSAFALSSVFPTSCSRRSLQQLLRSYCLLYQA